MALFRSRVKIFSENGVLIKIQGTSLSSLKYRLRHHHADYNQCSVRMPGVVCPQPKKKRRTKGKVYLPPECAPGYKPPEPPDTFWNLFGSWFKKVRPPHEVCKEREARRNAVNRCRAVEEGRTARPWESRFVVINLESPGPAVCLTSDEPSPTPSPQPIPPRALAVMALLDQMSYPCPDAKYIRCLLNMKSLHKIPSFKPNFKPVCAKPFYPLLIDNCAHRFTFGQPELKDVSSHPQMELNRDCLDQERVFQPPWMADSTGNRQKYPGRVARTHSTVSFLHKNCKDMLMPKHKDGAQSIAVPREVRAWFNKHKNKRRTEGMPIQRHS